MDERTRDLERRYVAGDLSVAGQLFQARYRLNQIREVEIELLALLGFVPAIDAYQAEDHPEEPRLSSYLWRKLGKYISLQLVIAAQIHPFRRIFDHHEDWCDIIRRYQPDFNVSTCQILKDLVEQQLLGLQNWKMGSLSPVKPFKEFHSLFTRRWSQHYIALRTIEENQPHQNSRNYWLIWNLLNSVERLREIREITKGNRNYVESITNWLHATETVWQHEAENFEFYRKPAEERISYLQAREELYNYLIPKALDLILLP